jgi:hypothetical protein
MGLNLLSVLNASASNGRLDPESGGVNVHEVAYQFKMALSVILAVLLFWTPPWDKNGSLISMIDFS